MDGAAHIKRSYHAAQERKDVMHWKQHHNVTFLLEDRHRLTYRVDVEHDISERKHNAFRVACGSRSVIDEHRCVVVAERYVGGRDIFVI